MSKNRYIIAGCNGVGKTTASLAILPEVQHCTSYISITVSKNVALQT